MAEIVPSDRLPFWLANFNRFEPDIVRGDVVNKDPLL
jgi:hypothetical protein